METPLVVVYEASGQLEALILAGLLEAQGIPVLASQEGAGHAYQLGVGPMGRVQLLVHAPNREAAEQVLADYFAGKFIDALPPEDGTDASQG